MKTGKIQKGKGDGLQQLAPNPTAFQPRHYLIGEESVNG